MLLTAVCWAVCLGITLGAKHVICNNAAGSLLPDRR